MKKLAAGVALAFLCVVGCESHQAVTIGDAEGRVIVRAGDPLLQLERADHTLLRFPLDAFQLGIVESFDPTLAYDPYQVALGASNPSRLHFLSPTAAEIQDSSDDKVTIELRYAEGHSARVFVQRDAPGRLFANFVSNDDGDGKVGFLRVGARVSATEGFYGLGMVEDDVNHRGKIRPMQVEADSSQESVNTENNVSVPFLIGTNGWGLFVKSDRLGAFDVAKKEPTLVEMTFASAEQPNEAMPMYLIAAEKPLDVTRHYYELTGKPHLPARWALGPLFWRNETTGQAQVLDDLKRIRDLDLATSGMWIDRPYATAVNSFDFDPTRYDDPAAMIKAAHDAGLRMALWHTPYLEPSTGPLRVEADANQYFIPMPNMQFNDWSRPIDFTNPGAYAFWQQLIHRYTDLGIEGFKLDYGEDIVTTFPPDLRVPWKFFDGSDERTMAYGYQPLYHRVYAETLPADGGFLLCRTGRWGDQQNVSVIWPGDLDATLTQHGEVFTDRNGNSITGVGGLPASLIVGLSLGPAGFPFFGSDTGGYRHSPPNKETYIRWFEQTALSSVMQVGDGSSQAPWEYTDKNERDDYVLSLYRQYARLHLRLFPYEWTMAQRLLTDGHPIMRPLGLAYPDLGVHPSDTYMFGDDLLVAPVVTAGVSSRDVVFPGEDWVDWWDGTEYAGAGFSYHVPAPLDRLPLFLRRGGIIPMLRPTIDTMSPVADPTRIDSFATTPGILYVRAVPPRTGASTFALYDGSSITVSHDDAVHVIVASGSEYTMGAIVELFPVKAPAAVELGGTATPAVDSVATLTGTTQGWVYTTEHGGALYLKLPPSVAATIE